MRKKRYKLPMRDVWDIQKMLTGNTDKLQGYVSLANIVADKMAWPKIEPGQPRQKEFAKQYLIKYRDTILNTPVNDPKTWVYFIRNGNFLKIGVSDDIESRIKSLQTASPFPLKLEAKIGCKGRRAAYSLEKKIHARYSSYHTNGEWFSSRVLMNLDEIGEVIEWERGDRASYSLFHGVSKSKKKNKSEWSKKINV